MVGEADIAGDPQRMAVDALDTIEAVITFYGNKTAQWLSDLTHSEAPWKDARGSLPDGIRSQEEITLAAMNEYYSSLSNDEEE